MTIKYKIEMASRFKKDYKAIKKRGYNLALLQVANHCLKSILTTRLKATTKVVDSAI